ncbi:MAG: AbgT family transporter [Balneolaceae bacterium]
MSGSGQESDEIEKKKPLRRGVFHRFLDSVERAGNRLPDPVTVFVIIIAGVMLISLISWWAGVSVSHPGTGATIYAENLFSGEMIQRIFREMPQTFAEFPPLGLVLVVMLGIGVADRTGLLATALKRFVEGAPSSLVTVAIVFAGIMSSLALDAGYVILIPLGALVFHGVGRHPLAGASLLVVPEGAPLRGEEGSLVPFYQSLVALLFFLFLLPGITFGIVTGQVKSDRDVARMSAESMAGMGAYIVLAFVAAHLIAFFNWSNLGLIIAVTGADLLQAAGFGGIPLIVSFVLVSALINLFIGSASAKWAIMAPIFVPMLMLMGYSPEVTQAAYRVGDSFTNILTPLLPYFPLIIIFAKKYSRNVGLGTLISLMVPYSVAFGLVSITALVVWILAGFPLGPDSPIGYP